ncbi:cupin domain-containing protein [Umezawaea sp.]|uniref:cupin domain-containing protein n=1 Tax=Umezawaea sp. TaxID=1955258 RepID=UPI002ECFED40
MTADDVIAALGLDPLPVEGGHFAQGHRSAELSTIYYLLRAGEHSAVHRLTSVEVYAHHAGAPLRMLLLHPDGSVTAPVLGPALAEGQRPQVVVPAGVWQASEPDGDWSLVTTVVVPPYTDDVVEFGDADALAAAYPSHADAVRRLRP